MSDKISVDQLNQLNHNLEALNKSLKTIALCLKIKTEKKYKVKIY